MPHILNRIQILFNVMNTFSTRYTLLIDKFIRPQIKLFADYVHLSTLND